MNCDGLNLSPLIIKPHAKPGEPCLNALTASPLFAALIDVDGFIQIHICYLVFVHPPKTGNDSLQMDESKWCFYRMAQCQLTKSCHQNCNMRKLGVGFPHYVKILNLDLAILSAGFSLAKITGAPGRWSTLHLGSTATGRGRWGSFVKQNMIGRSLDSLGGQDGWIFFDMGVSWVMGVPQLRWMVCRMENPI